MGSKRVVVAMSGGVDSSVTAVLLKDRGFEVIGITMQIWGGSAGQSSYCGIGNIKDAKKVADKLGIPHYVLDFRNMFKEKVIDDFCGEYREGRTPNPCIRCNQYIKFDALLKRAGQLDATYIATGHYARIEFAKRKKRYFLRKGIDLRKDQSYFLYILNQGQLKQTLMPLGEFTKTEVRRIARERDLPVADKPASQEICFILNNNYGEFLKQYLPEVAKCGPIVNKKGKIIGEHKGIIFYTIGQRKRIGIANREPLYVNRIDKENNTIVVGSKKDGYAEELLVDNVNLIYMKKITKPLKVKVRVRYLQPEASATLMPHKDGQLKVRFDEPQWAIAPGQSAVFYHRDAVMGGGRIKSI